MYKDPIQLACFAMCSTVCARVRSRQCTGSARGSRICGLLCTPRCGMWGQGRRQGFPYRGRGSYMPGKILKRFDTKCLVQFYNSILWFLNKTL